MVYSLLKRLNLFIFKTVVDKKAQGLIEYALIILMVVIVIIAALGLLGVQVNSFYENIINSLPES